jgi:hypothetical protein
MNANNIASIGFKLIGGTHNGSFFAVYPNTFQEIENAFTEARNFLKTSDNLWIEVQFKNREGLKKLFNLYKDQENPKKGIDATTVIESYDWENNTL